MLKLTGSVAFVLEVLEIFLLKCNLCLGGFENIPIEVLQVCCKRLVIC